jgi:predicted tellurium resistance membrane protein TerC
MLFAWITDPNAWLALGTLTLLEIVLGIDNIIFLSGCSQTPDSATQSCPTYWAGGGDDHASGTAGFYRLGNATDKPAIRVVWRGDISTRPDPSAGGLFLIWKASKEIHESIEGEEEGLKTRVSSFLGAIVQIMLLDIIFSLDSVITAVGLSDHLFIMMAAVVIAVGVMMFAARPIGEFVDRHPSVKMLALSFLILVGFTLILESFDVHVPKGYIYFAMFFSIAVETLNLWRNKKSALMKSIAPARGANAHHTYPFSQFKILLLSPCTTSRYY